MVRYLLDSNLCINFIRGRHWAHAALAKVTPLDVAISAVSVGELYEGVHRSRDPEKELPKTETFLKAFEIIALGAEEAKAWGLLEARLRKQGKPIEAEDGMIAATALCHGLTLVTGNTKHFERVKGLKLVDWEVNPPE